MNALDPHPGAVAPPYLVALNLTRRCNLRCAHCYLDAGTRQRGGGRELLTAEVKRLLDRIATLDPQIIVVLTGGEPLLRPDFPAIARHATSLGLIPVVGTNGTLLDERRVAQLQEAGVQAVGVSVDSMDADYHDRFRGRRGAWAATVAGIDACRRARLMFQIHFSVTEENAGALPDMIDFARSVGAVALNVFFIVCTGRGEKLADVSRETYGAVLDRVTEAARTETSLLVRAKCAPQFRRIALQIDPDWSITPLHGYEAGGCLAGTRYCRVTPEGDVTPCPYMEMSVGSVRERDFVDIWQDAPLFQQLRGPHLTGRCGICEYRRVCGGCRARPLARTGDPMGEDFLCDYQPQGRPLIEPARDGALALTWSAAAEAIVHRVPPFVRSQVRRRAEAHARSIGASIVLPEHLHALARKRFGAGGAAFGRSHGPQTGGHDR